MQGDAGEDVSTPAAALVGQVDPTSVQDINFDDGALSACNIIIIITKHFIQRIIPTYTVTRCIMLRKQLLLRSKELNNLMPRLLWSEKRTRLFNWQKPRPTLGTIPRSAERDLLDQVKLLLLTVSWIWSVMFNCYSTNVLLLSS